MSNRFSYIFIWRKRYLFKVGTCIIMDHKAMQAKQIKLGNTIVMKVMSISKAFFEHFQQLTLNLCEFFRDVSCYGIYLMNLFLGSLILYFVSLFKHISYRLCLNASSFITFHWMVNINWHISVFASLFNNVLLHFLSSSS